MLRPLLLAALCTALAPAAAAPVRTPHVEVARVAERTAVVPGEPPTVVLRLEWRRPAGFRAGEIDWPVPECLPAGPLTNFGYKGEALHLVRVAAPRDLALRLPGQVPSRLPATHRQGAP
jgi:thiol:disulfide interchange protein DsbD